MDQNYGQFKSDVRCNIATLTVNLVREFSRQQSRHDEDPANCTAPTKTVSIGRDQYGLILSGRDANEERRLSALRPAFHNTFCKNNNLSAWAKVGAVPCTRQAMRHKRVISEAARDGTVIVIECFDPYLSFDYKTATMLEVQQQNKLACDHLNELCFNGDVFLIKVRQRAVNLVQRLSEQTTEEERVVALAKSGIGLSSIFFVVGPKCLSTDEIFKAIQYKKKLEAWEKSTKESNKLVDERALHEKVRAVESKGTKTKPDYEKLLRWKMGDEKFKKEGKGKKLDALQIIWN
jgi:hypothetical protein